MSVKSHPQYEEWSVAFDNYLEAQNRLRDALLRNDPALRAYVADSVKAQKEYNAVCDKLDLPPEEEGKS